MNNTVKLSKMTCFVYFRESRSSGKQADATGNLKSLAILSTCQARKPPQLPNNDIKIYELTFPAQGPKDLGFHHVVFPFPMISRLLSSQHHHQLATTSSQLRP
jgi:hypothetical protein